MNLKVLNLTDNKFICNCQLLWFRDWIDRTTVDLPGEESYMCDGSERWKGKPLLEFTRDKIDCSSQYISKYAIGGIIVGAVVITALSGILVYRNRWRLRLRLYLLSKRGRRFLRDERRHARHLNYGAINNDDRRYHYDAYISCNECDFDWVLCHLLPDIDSDEYENARFGGDFKLYYDPRDQDPGSIILISMDLLPSFNITKNAIRNLSNMSLCS